MDQAQETARAFIRPRPIRVAYLLADGDHSHLKLDAIFVASMAAWGGRYSLICPCENGFPRESYLSWMRVYDPDIIYSFIDLSDENLRKIREVFAPAYLVRHTENIKGEAKSRDFRIELPIAPLASLSTTLQYARAYPASAPQPVRVVDYLPGQPNDRFIDDNFGSFYNSYSRWPIPENLADAVKPLAVASEKLLSAPNRGRRYEGETVGDAIALLSHMAGHRNTYGLGQIAADATPRIELREAYDNAFTLVVGNTFEDRVAYWNLRSRDPVFLGREVTTLIVDPARLEEEAFFAALAEFLKTRNGVPRNSGGPWVQIRSASIPVESLSMLCERFRGHDNWNGYHVGSPITLDGIAPSAQVLSNARHLAMGGFFERAPEWKEFPAVGDKAHPPVVMPSHIAHLQSQNFATSGSWALDVDIERQENHSRYSNVRHKWFFPRRLRFHQAFLGFYESKGWGREYRHTRANALGALSLYAGFGEELPTINLPTDEVAFQFAMQRGDTWPPFSRSDKWEPPHGPFEWAQPSDKGRYLIGTLRMFGGLQEAGAVLLHSYWRAIFEELGGTIGSARRSQIKDAIKKKLRAVTTPPGNWDDDTWQRMTSLVATEAYQVRVPQQTLSYDDFQKRHEPYLEREKVILAEHKAKEPDDWLARANRSLRNGLQERCARNVLFQGYRWKCDTCYNSNWNDIASLKPELTCSICGASEPAPVDKPWSFRLNGFLQDAMREHGITALVWCLVTLEGRSKDSFFYLGPHELWNEYPKNVDSKCDHEADLICVLDGKVHLCEVKSSSRDIELASLLEVAKRLRPDFVTLAVMEEHSDKLAAKLAELKRGLTGTGVDAQLLTYTDDERRNDAYLP